MTLSVSYKLTRSTVSVVLIQCRLYRNMAEVEILTVRIVQPKSFSLNLNLFFIQRNGVVCFQP